MRTVRNRRRPTGLSSRAESTRTGEQAKANGETLLMNNGETKKMTVMTTNLVIQPKIYGNVDLC